MLSGLATPFVLRNTSSNLGDYALDARRVELDNHWVCSPFLRHQNTSRQAKLTYLSDLVRRRVGLSEWLTYLSTSDIFTKASKIAFATASLLATSETISCEARIRGRSLFVKGSPTSRSKSSKRPLRDGLTSHRLLTPLRSRTTKPREHLTSSSMVMLTNPILLIGHPLSRSEKPLQTTT